MTHLPAQPNRDPHPSLPSLTSQQFSDRKSSAGDIDFRGLVDNRYVDVMVNTSGDFLILTSAARRENNAFPPSAGPADTECYTTIITRSDKMDWGTGFLIDTADRAKARLIHDALCAGALSESIEDVIRLGLEMARELRVRAEVSGGKFDGAVFWPR